MKLKEIFPVVTTAILSLSPNLAHATKSEVAPTLINITQDAWHNEQDSLFVRQQIAKLDSLMRKKKIDLKNIAVVYTEDGKFDFNNQQEKRPKFIDIINKIYLNKKAKMMVTGNARMSARGKVFGVDIKLGDYSGFVILENTENIYCIVIYPNSLAEKDRPEPGLVKINQ